MAAHTIDAKRIAPGMVNAYCPLPGLATGGQPQRADLEGLAHEGFRTILDLRMPSEPRGYDMTDAARTLGMEYLNIPVGPEPLTDAQFDQMRQLLRDEARRPVLVHCASGNRVGILLLPYLMLDAGKSPREALEMAMTMGMRSPQLAAPALAYVARHGGKLPGDA